MTFISHAAVGTCIGIVLAETTGLDYSLTIPLNVGLSLAPDINILWRNITQHHDDITHYPVFWLFVAVIAFILELSLGSQIFLITKSVLLSSTIHLLMDTFGLSIGVHWLAPFYKKEFSFTKLGRPLSGLKWQEKIKLFQKTRHLYYELVVLSIGVLLSAGLMIV